MAFALIVLVGIGSRIVTFGNPIVIVDDQFYHYVGHAMIGGQWPYIDIWDRKPIGLFLIFAGIAAIGGGSVLVMQLIATAFAIATAWVIRHIASHFASPRGALFAAFAYLLTLPLFGGQTAQSPVFYNLLIAGAAALLIGAAKHKHEDQTFARSLSAMLLCGLALIVKQSSVVEGAAIGLGFLWIAFRRGMTPPRLAILGAAMVAVALAPSLVALGVYAAHGADARDAYLFANYVSIFMKTSHGSTARLAGFGFFLLYVFPLAVAAIAGSIVRRRSGDRSDAAWLVNGWMIAALLGYFAIPNFFDHYALPLIAPLAVSAASLFGAPSGRLYFAGIAGFALMQGSMLDLGYNRRERQRFDHVNAAVAAAAQGGCLFSANAPSQFYFTTPPCRTSAYIFPDHLTTMVEARGIGVDQTAELTRVLAARPAVIAVLEEAAHERRSVMNRQLATALRDGYREILYVPVQHEPSLLQTMRLWQRRDLRPPAPAIALPARVAAPAKIER